jgi:ribose transport system substrate-binding protein
MSAKYVNKSFFVAVAVMMVVASVVGFTAAPAQAEEPFTIGLSMHFMRDDYAVCVVGAAEAVAEKYGGKIVATDANADPQKQLADVENLVAQNVDALIVVPFDEKAILPALEKADEKGIPIIAITTIPNADYIVSTVGGDGDYQNGKATGEFLVEQLGGEGKIAVIDLGFSLWRIDERIRGFEDAIKDTDIEVVAQQSGVAQDEVQNIVQNILVANPDLDGVWATFSNQIVGASDALQAADKPDVVLTGIDADKAIMARINEGWVTGSAAQFPEVHGTLATEAAFQYLMGEEVEKELEVPVMMVTKDNLVDAYYDLWDKCAPGEVAGLDLTKETE